MKLAQILAVLDEKTTDICRFLDGKFINVSDSLGMLERLEGVTDPDQVKTDNPWLSTGTDSDGRYIRIKYPDGREILVARVERSGVGTADDRGEYSESLRMDELQVLGIGPPPYHANCRSTITPVIT